MALKIAFAYRIVSTLAILVADSVQSIHMLAQERSQIYFNREDRNIASITLKGGQKRIVKQMAREMGQ